MTEFNLICHLINHQFIIELWQYLFIKDICQLLSVNKTIRLICLNINKLVSQKLHYKGFVIRSEEMSTTIQNIINLFPKISDLELRMIIFQQNNTTERKTIEFNKCLSYLNQCELFRKSLERLLLLNLNDEGSVHIRKLENVKNLVIIQNIMTDRGFSNICDMTNLTSLRISTSITIAYRGFNHLANLTNLTSLRISCTKIQDDNLLVILISLVTLTELTLIRCDNITNIGYSNLYYLVNLTSLTIEHHIGISDPTLFHISSCVRLTQLKLSQSYIPMPITNIGLSYLSHLVNLKSLDLRYSEDITTLVSISSLINLTSLNLGDCIHLIDDGLSYLSMLTKMSFLNLDNCSEIESLSFLSSMKLLKALFLCNCKQIIQIEFAYISSLTNLEVLEISECNITHAQFLFSLKSITKLYMIDCNMLTNAGVINLKYLIKIKMLDIRRCKVCNVWLELISFLPCLEILYISFYNELINNEGLTNLCNLHYLNELYIFNKDSILIYDINLSLIVVEMLINLKCFSLKSNILNTFEGVIQGFAYVNTERERRKFV